MPQMQVVKWTPFLYRVGDGEVRVWAARGQNIRVGDPDTTYLWVQQESGHRFRAPISRLRWAWRKEA
jgi:hypothetical protein